MSEQKTPVSIDLTDYIKLTEQVESYKGAILTWNEYSKKVNEELSRLREENARYLEGWEKRMAEVEQLREDKTNLETSVKNLVEMYEEKVEERKELVEALRARYEHLKWLKDVNTTPPSVIDEINFLQSLISKFEAPNT